MLFRSLAIPMILCAVANAEWSSIGGILKQVTAASDGTVWGVNPSDAIFRWTSGQWQQIPGGLMQISAGSAQHVWGVTAGNNIFKWNGSGWVQMPGLLKQVSVASDGTVWGTTGNDNVFRYDAPTNNWIVQPGVLRVVAVGSAQEIWGVNSGGNVFRWNGSGWEQKPGSLSTIAVGNDATVWGAGSNGVFQWDPAQSNWVKRDGDLKQISVGNANIIWGVNSANAIYQRNIAFTQQGPTITITGNLTNPSVVPATPASPPSVLVNYGTVQQAGQLVCAMSLGSETANCGQPGTRKAEYVGTHSLNMKCDTGFFDPIYGGTCWSCPADDGHGAYIRGTTPVTDNDACWRTPKEYWGAATKVRDTPWAWECPSGSFWDPKGSCWSCPADTPRRSQYAVDSPHACVSAVHQTKPASLVKFSGCTAPDPAKMKREGKLAGKTMPGKPFLDIAGGGCYTCPTIDSDGNFLITLRNGNPIYGENQGCTVYQNYKPATFVAPGLSGLSGVKSLLVEMNALTPKALLSFLHALAVASGKTQDSPDARAWVAQELTSMANSPFRNNSFRTLVLGFLINALDTPAASRTASQQALLASMGTFATHWRIHVAQQSLNMYDAWKVWDDANKAAKKASSLMQLFDYGTVPVDFQTLVTAVGTPTGVGVGMAGMFGGAANYSSAIHWVQSTQDGDKVWTAANGLYRLLQNGNIFKTAGEIVKGAATAAAIGSGATAIAVAGAIISSVASAQFQAIVTARPNLEAALAEARRPVTMDQIYTQGTGATQVQYLWIMAMDSTNEIDDMQVKQLVNSANETAKATGYAVPK